MYNTTVSSIIPNARAFNGNEGRKTRFSDLENEKGVNTASIAPRSLTGDTVDQTSHENRSIDVDEGPEAIAGAAVPAAEKEGLKMYVYVHFRRMCRIEP